MGIVFYILIPVYQIEEHLKECIDSVLQQTYKQYHIILIDDGSKDKSGEICDFYAEKYSNIHVIHQNNSGQLSARLNAVKIAKQLHKSNDSLGYILFLDADDILATNTLQIIIKLNKQYNADCIVMDWTRFYTYEEIKSSLTATLQQPIFLTEKHEIYKRVLIDNSLNSMCRKVIKIEKFPEKEYDNLYHLRNGEDLIQSLDIYKEINSLLLSNTRMYFYRQNPMSVTHRKPTLKNASDFTIRELVLEFLSEANEFSKKDYEEYYCYCRDFLLGEIFIFIGSDMSVYETCCLIDLISESTYFAKVTKNKRWLNCTSKAKTITLKLLLNKLTRKICIIILRLLYSIRQ